MTGDEIFDLLDLDGDGLLSREELGVAARRMGWHWHEAPFFAVLDYLSIRAPLSRRSFERSVDSMYRDPHGPFGEVLRTASFFADLGTAVSVLQSEPPSPLDEGESDRLVAWLRHDAGEEAATDYERLLCGHAPRRVDADEAALLVIDPQISFTRGTWMRSIGPRGHVEIEPIRIAFENVAARLGSFQRPVETMFTRCPFPPASYDWDRGLAKILDRSQPYFVKPGNSALWPPTNGLREWVGGLLERGRRTLVLAGCTLNSCVRVSSVDLRRHFREEGLEVLVDLHLCGARRSNYLRSGEFGGVSSVESTVNEVRAAGAAVAAAVLWV